MKMNKTLGLGILLLTLITACNQTSKRQDSSQEMVKPSIGKEKIYKGVLNIGCDPGLQSVINQEVEIFRYDHDSVQVNLEYKPEEELLNEFRKGSMSTIILTRVLDAREIENFKKDTIYIRQLSEASDAVAIIGNQKMDDSNLNMETLRSYINPKATSNIKVVFDRENKSVVNHVLKVLGYKNEASKSVYATASPKEVFDYVETHTDAIGFIPYNLLSDTDDEQVKALLKRVKILSLTAKNQNGEGVRVSANQSDIATGDYPLTRTVNAVTRFTYSDGLDWLFINFMAQSRGAKIFLKAGLIPTKMPERQIIVNSDGLKTN
jgi:phosphate transport system substrate-binding protein